MRTQDEKGRWIEAEPLDSGYGGKRASGPWLPWLLHRFANWLLRKTETTRVR